MGYLRVLSVFGRKRLWVPVGSLFVFAVLGCGNIYRPVVTSLPPVQPAPQPTKYALVISCGTTPNASAPTIDQVCNSTSTPGLASLVDFSGDSLTARINVGTGGPRWLALSQNGATAYIVNADTTINSFFASSSPANPLENKSVNTSTLPLTAPGAATPNTLLFTGKYLYASQPGRSSVEVLATPSTGGAPGAFLEIPIAQPPVNFVGNASGQRIYVVSQGPNAASCPNSATPGSVTSIETNTNTISAVFNSASTPIAYTGACPIYGVMSTDDRRTFILNQGGDTITVIDSQQNQIDSNPKLTGDGSTPDGSIKVGQGPVWADILDNASLLAVASAQPGSASGTVTLINISTDSFGHDGPNFGDIVASIPVGPNPSSLAFLQDGSQLFVANRNDPAITGDPAGNGSVSAINLTNYTVSKTIPLPRQTCTGNPSAQCNVHPISIAATTGTPLGKVYVVSPDTNMLTILRTDNDTIYENLPLTGNGVQVRVTSP